MCGLYFTLCLDACCNVTPHRAQPLEVVQDYLSHAHPAGPSLPQCCHLHVPCLLPLPQESFWPLEMLFQAGRLRLDLNGANLEGRSQQKCKVSIFTVCTLPLFLISIC